MRLNFNPSLTESILLSSPVSPAALAYLGDAVYELYVRTYYLAPPKRLNDYHLQVVETVKAESQAAFLRLIEPELSLEEKDILRQGRNAASARPRRIPAEIYQQASSLETLIGYLYLHDSRRLNELLAKLDLG